MNKPTLRNRPLARLIGAGLGLGAIGAQAAAPTFQATDLASGYTLASADDAAASKKQAEHSCGEGGCGGDMGGAASDKSADAKAADAKAAQKVASEQQPAPAAKK
ncbi:MAG: hypothetical protein JWQ90_5156 [Hydrocarboniphaga sp.]|uniref:hypothetical protein n=1 Tax=Hydrocarboniphaga sp. TaxID=2033016 RepID=UPI002632A80F|nr:hypothetical protein [Hydrocarboniphaga sp.]MDB5972706.1 hypothetical protein [Hydrocarboniphaga sp.]